MKSKSFNRSRMRNDDLDGRRASSRGLIPRAKIKTVKMTFVIVFGTQINFVAVGGDFEFYND